MEIQNKIKRDLPNFPAEIIEDWLLPRAKDLGWPPTHQNWQGILFTKDIEFWSSVSWLQEDKNLLEMSWSKTTLNIINDLQSAYALDEKNIYHSLLGMSGKTRYLSALKYLFEHGSFPKPICLLKEGGNGYSVVDGHHRFVAWKVSYTLINTLNKIQSTVFEDKANSFRETLQRKWGIDSIKPFSPIQRVWIASH